MSDEPIVVACYSLAKNSEAKSPNYGDYELYDLIRGEEAAVMPWSDWLQLARKILEREASASWTKTPPTEPGFYWVRKNGVSLAEFAPSRPSEQWDFIGGDEGARTSELVSGGFEFWTQRLAAPGVSP